MFVSLRSYCQRSSIWFARSVVGPWVDARKNSNAGDSVKRIGAPNGSAFGHGSKGQPAVRQ